jgi:CMP-2-keto-3-deoxyoctulosonic acid synthetase
MLPINSCRTLVSPIRTEEEAFNRNIVKCVFDANHTALFFSRALIPHSK